MKKFLFGVTLTVLTAAPLLVSCQGEGPIRSQYVADDGDTGPFISERDCGFSAEVSGVDFSGNPVERVIWGFCDPVGYSVDGTIWEDAWVPSNTYGIIAKGADPTELPVTTPVIKNDLGGLSGFKQLIVDTDIHCTRLQVPYPREWISSMLTLPDNDPRYETIAVFYQNYCINFSGDIEFGSAGLAMATWDAFNPDAQLSRTRISDNWFKPGLITDNRVPWDINTFAYGVAPIVTPIPFSNLADVYIYMCGGGGDCYVARSTVQANDNGENVGRYIGDTTNWSYWTGSVWHPFPPADATGTCSPTVLDTCGPDYPAGAVVAAADPNNARTLPSGEVSMKFANGTYYLLYAYNLDNGFAYRAALSPTGPFSEPRELEITVGACKVFCRAPIWHPELDRVDKWAVSYYDRLGLNEIIDTEDDRDAGLIEMTYVDPLPSYFDLPPIEDQEAAFSASTQRNSPAGETDQAGPTFRGYRVLTD